MSRLSLSSIAVLLTAALALGSSADAQFCDLDDDLLFRVEVDRFIVEMATVAAQAEALGLPAGAQLRRQLTELESTVDHADRAQMSELCEVFARSPVISAMPGLLTDSLAAGADLATLPHLATLSHLDDAVEIALSDPTERRGIDTCPVLSPDVRNSLFIANVALQRVALGLQTACEATQCVSLVCIVACAFAGVANTAVLVTQAVLDLDSYCFGNQFVASIDTFADDTAAQLAATTAVLDQTFDPNLDTAISAVTSQQVVDELAANLGQSLSGTTADVTALLNGLATQAARAAALQSGNLRNRIERSLRAGNEARVVSYQLPTAQGGLLETVREVTAEAIQRATGDPQAALELFELADRELNGEHFKRAYSNYREAYRAAVGASGDEPCCPR